MAEPLPRLQLWARLRPDAGAPWLARSLVGALEPIVGCATCDRVRLLVSELLTNSVRHARSPHAIVLRIDLGERLRAEVVDAGAFRWRALGRRRPGDGGLGLLLVAQVAERWGLRTGPPTTAWFELELDRPGGLGTGGPGYPGSVAERSHEPLRGREEPMGEKTDDLKGRAKEAAGVLADDDDLRREGKLDQAGAAVKGAADRTVDRVKEAIDRIADGDDEDGDEDPDEEQRR